MSAVPRARTSYDYYGDQLKEDYFEDMKDYIPIQGRQTPIGMVRPSSPGGPRLSVERQSRPRTRSDRPGLGPRSRTQIDYGQIEVDENPYSKPMDPINKQYYYKKWRNQPPQPQPPIYREGRLGSPWRHIKACINNAGNHLVFIDGTIKSEENFFYPPESMFEPPNFSMYISPRMPRRSLTQVPQTYRGDSRGSSFNERARQGFQYWYHQKKPIDCEYILTSFISFLGDS
ncbi:uncharacterized protein LOC101852025 [Aplysia californica]|uniref:Uncharacterized protein LOC101852025 n=1 Tax=Aplysia californica TaxID=6500 RepID=A0ABM1A1B2_APLCA|nr:uncharacterized protein LOC101852025 [Aplysia californica]